jgi:isopentenyl-diphosphate delta-isomerase
MSDISQRKEDHIDLAVRGDVGFHRTTTLFEHVRFVHDALPDLNFADINTSVRVLGKTLRAPLLIAAMTGGTERAGAINRALASIADRRGYAFGLGSQRPMLVRPESASTFLVREQAPNVLLLGNLGVVQARETPNAAVLSLIERAGLDALCIHLNPAMELIQAEGDRDFRGGTARLADLASALPVPVIAKETGCGLSGAVAERLRAAGVRHVDVSGAGGTSWVAVETHRAPAERKALGQTFWDWGIPTAASLALVSRHGFETVFATGGVTNGLEVAKAIALGATAAGIARPVLQAYEAGGEAGALAFLDRVELELKTAMLLVGARDLDGLRRAPRLITGELSQWVTLGAVTG